jgi:hypothetical protein
MAVNAKLPHLGFPGFRFISGAALLQERLLAYAGD